MFVDPESLRIAMRRWSTGVTVVTTNYQAERHGMTVSSFTSVSLQPPTVLVSLQKGTRTHELVSAARFFGVTILTSEQQEISDRFAGRIPDTEDRFAGLETIRLESGVDLLADGLAFFDCRVVATYEVGSHTLFIGHVLAVQTGLDSQPLVYYDRTYHRLQE